MSYNDFKQRKILIQLDGSRSPLGEGSPQKGNCNSLISTSDINKTFCKVERSADVFPLSDFIWQNTFLETFTLSLDFHKKNTPKRLRTIFLKELIHTYRETLSCPIKSIIVFEFGDDNGLFHMHALSMYANHSIARNILYYFKRYIGNVDQKKIKGGILDMPRTYDYIIKDIDAMSELGLFPLTYSCDSSK